MWINAKVAPIFKSLLKFRFSTALFWAIFRVIISHAAPWGIKFPPILIPIMKTNNKGIDGKLKSSINREMIGMNITYYIDWFEALTNWRLNFLF